MLSIASSSMATSADEAVSAARQIGYPVALKAVGPEIVHKTEAGGVMLDIPDERIFVPRSRRSSRGSVTP